MALKSEIPLPTLKRFSLYLTLLNSTKQGEWISTSFVSSELGIKAITVRKDINYLGIKGVPQKGFPKVEIMSALKNILGGESCRDLILIGSWGFGAVFKEHPELIMGDFKLRVCFDFIDTVDKSGEIPIYPIANLQDLIPRLGVSVALLSVDPVEVQTIADKLYSWGIKGILNLTPEKIKTPEGCSVTRFNLLTPLSELLGKMTS